MLSSNVVALVRWLVQQRKSSSSFNKSSRLFLFNTNKFRYRFKKTCAILGLSPKLVPHSLRHGGCTRLYHVVHMPINDIMIHGRWKSLKSCDRYIQTSISLSMTIDTPDWVMKVGKWLVKHNGVVEAVRKAAAQSGCG